MIESLVGFNKEKKERQLDNGKMFQDTINGCSSNGAATFCRMTLGRPTLGRMTTTATQSK